MHYKGDKQGKSVLPVLMHGDAAFAGQGIVFESMQFSRTSDFATGGKYIQFYSTLSQQQAIRDETNMVA